MAELRVRTDLDRNTIAISESPGAGTTPAYRFGVFARATAAPADSYLVIDLPRGFYLPEDDLGERDARVDVEVGWQVEVAPEPDPTRGAIAIRLVCRKATMASTQLQVSTLVEGRGDFDPERDAFPFDAAPHLFGTPRPPRDVFDMTFRRGLRAPLGWLLYRGLYRRLFSAGIAGGVARAALTLAADGHGAPRPSSRRLLDRETRELVQIMHGRQLGDGPVRALRRWIARASPAAVFRAVRADLLSGRPQRLAIDVGLPQGAPWSVFAAMVRPHATVVPFQYRVAPNGTAILDVYDPAHPGDPANNVLHIDLAIDRYEYRDWASETPSGPTVLAALEHEPFTTPQSTVQAGIAQLLGLI